MHIAQIGGQNPGSASLLSSITTLMLDQRAKADKWTERSKKTNKTEERRFDTVSVQSFLIEALSLPISYTEKG